MPKHIVDTHCHLDIIASKGLPIPEALDLASQAGVEKIVQIGIDRESSQFAKKLSHETKTPIEIYYTIGSHPTENQEFPHSGEIVDLVKDSITDSKFVGVGEIGVDLYHDASTKKEQLEILDLFLSLSAEHSLPVVIHSRDAFAETYEALKRWEGKAFGVIHCFTYDYEMGKKFFDLGYYISFSGIVAFKNAKEIHDAAEKLPLEGILIETDAPFLAPPPFRGKDNQPAYVNYVLSRMQELRKEDPEHIENVLYSNSLKFINRKAYHHA